MKTCKRCTVSLPVSDFHKVAGTDRPMGVCKVCYRKRTLDYRDTVKAKTKVWSKRASLKRHYGLTLDEFTAMLDRQGHVCYICAGPPTPCGKETSLVVDHDHATGIVRGLLCSNCNFALGLMKDSPATLRAAAAYLESRSNGSRPAPVCVGDSIGQAPQVSV